MSRSLPKDALRPLLAAVEPARKADPRAVQNHLDNLTKPPGSLGYLEELALRLALVYGDPPPTLRHRTAFVLAADHGVASHGVSAYPREVTAQMCRNFGVGGAAINAIARAVEADVVTVDVGVDADLDDVAAIVHRKVRRGTRDLTREAALTPDEVTAAILTGAELVARRDEVDIVLLGEMGIGNTTAASAVAAALTKCAVADMVGPGTGVDRERLAHKRALVEAALRRLSPDIGPLEILAEVGGLEIAALAGVVLGAARAGRAVVTDGFIATTGALAAVRLCPPARDYLFPSHRSAEPGHAALLNELRLRPLLELDLRLGEGTGAALALPLLDAAGAILREMATFAEAGVATRARQ